MAHLVFGNENARDDDLLYDCHVAPPAGVAGKAILRGRWGVGKTGHLLHRNRMLTEALRNVDVTKAFLWYRDEGGLDTDAIFNLKEYCGQDSALLKRVLEALWESEILRVEIQILAALWEYYQKPEGKHWSYVRKHATVVEIANPIWDLVPHLTAVVSNDGKAANVARFQSKLRNLLGHTAWNSVQKCLLDIKEEPVQPAVAVEPIETPQSPLEKKDPSLSQILTTALIDLYIRKFEISQKVPQLIQLQLSVPWHRGIRKTLKEPQKLRQNEGEFRWSRSTLRRFINVRLEWEFKRVGRSFTSKGNLDAFAAFFGTLIQHTNSHFPEEVFSYLLRHTRHRPRDLQRLCREIVEFQMANRRTNSEGYNVDDVLKARGHGQLSTRVIKAAVRKTSYVSAEEQVLEATRRYPDVANIIKHFRGLPIPFSLEMLSSRIEGIVSVTGGEIDRFQSQRMLWRSGILGVELTPKSALAVQRLKGQFGSDSIVTYRRERKEVVKCFLFEYNTSRNIQEILNDFGHAGAHADNECDLSLVLHPMMFEYLNAKPTDGYPVGT